MDSQDQLNAYKAKRNFSITSEPEDGGEESNSARRFVVQKHWATRLHYDFRLELGGTMKSWAVPKGPSFDPRDKRMAVHVEDHPISYSSFEGTIPPKQYGAGKVIIWDEGTWHPIGDPEQGYRDGNLKFEMHGHKLNGKWALIRMKSQGEKKEPWLLIKEKDELAKSATEFSVVEEMPDSVKGLTRPNSSKRATTACITPKLTTTKKKPASGKEQSTVLEVHEYAVKAQLPDRLAPQLATLASGPPSDSQDWVYEIKFDGYRLLARLQGNVIRLFTRNGNDWSEKLLALQSALVEMRLPDGWFDGEIVVFNDHGVPDFGALQNSFDTSKTENIKFFVFDMPYCNGYDMRNVPLEIRRMQLQSLLAKTTSDSVVRFSDAFEVPAESIVASACQLGLEGVIGKRLGSMYRSTRSADWIKLKCSQRQEFVVGGWTDPQGSRTGFGSLLLGVHNDIGELVYAGKVGTGFNDKVLKDIQTKLNKLAAIALRAKLFFLITQFSKLVRYSWE
jgi:bifunctional non-homologous end joining protein LigD